MRVVNDRDERSNTPELGFLDVASQSVFNAMGYLTVILAPLPMIAAYGRLAEPWPKVTALFGAILALKLLQVPLMLVLLLFIYGLFVSDAIAKKSSLRKLLFSSSCVALGVGASILVVTAQLEQITPAQLWTRSVGQVVDQIQTAQKAVSVERHIDWEAFKGDLLFEGPFLFVSWMLLSLWVSVGLAAHLGWFDPKHPYAARQLREFRFSRWVSVIFVALMAADYAGLARWEHLIGGTSSLLGALLFIQGTIFISEILARRQVKPRLRTLVYSLSILVGFYAIMGLGVVTPWFPRRQNKLEEVI